MGTPAEHRSLLAHLINVRIPYSYENPRFVLMCEGITELTEELDPDSEDIQYICEKTKTVNVKSYSKKLEVDMTYVKDNEVINYANYLLRAMPVGQKAAGDYVRFNKDELMYSEEDCYIAIRQKATVYPESIGGSAEDPLHSKFSMGSAGDQVIGYIKVHTSGGHTDYLWTQTNLEVPYVTKISGVNIESFYTNMDITDNSENIVFKLEGKKDSTIKLYNRIGNEVPITSTTWSGNTCTCTVSANSLVSGGSGKVTVSFQQTNNNESSVTSHPLTFNLKSYRTPPVILTEPQTTVQSSQMIQGTSYANAEIKMVNTSAPQESPIEVTTNADSNGSWQHDINLITNKENIISVTQKIEGATSRSNPATVTIKNLGVLEINDGQTSQQAANFHVEGKGLKGATIHLLDNENEVELDDVNPHKKTVQNDGTFDIYPKNALSAGSKTFTFKQTLDNKTSTATEAITFTLSGQ